MLEANAFAELHVMTRMLNIDNIPPHQVMLRE